MGQLGYTPGDIGWTELTTTNGKAALNFYAAIAGWEDKGEPMPGYQLFGRGDEQLGGISSMPGEDGAPPTPKWMPYITVADLKAALAKVEELGGTICLPPMALPRDGGHIAIIKDPQGVTTGLAQYTSKDD